MRLIVDYKEKPKFSVVKVENFLRLRNPDKGGTRVYHLYPGLLLRVETMSDVKWYNFKTESGIMTRQNVAFVVRYLESEFEKIRSADGTPDVIP